MKIPLRCSHLKLIRGVAHLRWVGDRDTLLMLYRAIVRSKLDYGCIVYGTASNTGLRQLDSIHNAGVRVTLGVFSTSPVSSMYTKANEAPLEERRLKLSMHYYLKTRACTDNPAHHALHEFDPTIRDLYLTRPNGRGGMTRPSTQPIVLKREEAIASAEIDVELVCPSRTLSVPPGTHEYDPKKHNLIEGVSKCMITREEAQAKLREYHVAQGPHDEVYTDGSKINERVGATGSSITISRMVRRPAASCPRDSQMTAPSLLLKLQPLLWHWTIIGTWTLYSTMLYSTRTQCLACRRFRAKIRKTLSFVIWWTSSGHWATKAHVFASAGCQAIVALRVMRWWTS